MLKRRTFRLSLPSRTLTLGPRTLVMGVLNVTPDSFSDGGKFLDPQKAVEHAFAMERDGADLLDLGGESTRPGSTGTSAEEELSRVLPVLQGLRGVLKIPISIDTRKAEAAEAAIAAGAEIINDVSGLKSDPRIAEVASRRGVPLILMHMRGEPRTMQQAAFAREVMKDVCSGLRTSVARARKAGVRKSQIVIDPGIGFGKSFDQNYELLRKLPELAKLGYPLLVGAGGHIAQGLSGSYARPGWQAGAAGRAHLGHRSHSSGKHLWRRAHRARARCRGNGTSSASL